MHRAVARSPLARLAAVALLAGPLALADAPAPLATEILHQVDPTAGDVDPTSIVVAPGGARTAIRARSSKRWMVDGAPGREYPEVGPLVFSPDGKHWAHVARGEGDTWILVMDGEDRWTGLRALAFGSLRFSGDSAHLAFQATPVEDGKQIGEAIYVDGKPGPAFRAVEVRSLVLSHDGAHVAYLATDGANDLVVVDGKPLAPYVRGGTGHLAMSADGTTVAFVLERERKQRIVVNGVEGKPFDLVGPATFAPTGHRWFHAGLRGGKTHVVVDGVESPPYDGLGRTGAVFSPDGAHIAYAVPKDGAFLVVRDGKEGPAFARLGSDSLVFSPDGAHLAYWAADKEKPFFVVDDARQPEVDDAGGFRFAPDSKRFAYAARKGDAWVVVADGKDGPKTDAIARGSPVWSPDGKHVACEARKDGRSFVYVDGVPGMAMDEVEEGSLTFGKDGATAAVAARIGESWHVVIGDRASRPFQRRMPDTVLAADGPASFHAWFALENVLVHARVSR